MAVLIDLRVGHVSILGDLLEWLELTAAENSPSFAVIFLGVTRNFTCRFFFFMSSI
jgi:hypothetical protein